MLVDHECRVVTKVPAEDESFIMELITDELQYCDLLYQSEESLHDKSS